MALLILLAITTNLVAAYHALQSRQRFWIVGLGVYLVLTLVNLSLALNLWTLPNPARVLTIVALLAGTLVLLPLGLLSMLRGAGRDDAA